MNRQIITRTTAVLAVLGTVASGAAILAILGKSLGVSELFISIFSLAVGVLAGVFSMTLSRLAMKLRLSRRVFVSYSHTDEAIAHEIAEALRSSGARVWLDQERLEPGQPILNTIKKGIDQSDAFVALLSKQATPSLDLELEIARAKGLRIIPVLVSDGEMPYDLRGLRYIDLREERSSGIQELVNATV